GKRGAKGHKVVLCNNMQNIMKLRIRHLARKVLKNLPEDGMQYSVTYTEHVKGKTSTTVDVVAVLERQGR
ncbi:Histone H4, partial [Glycine soja]